MEYTHDELLEESVRADVEAEGAEFKQMWQRAEELEDMIANHDCTEESDEGCDCHEWRIELESLNRTFSITVL